MNIFKVFLSFIKDYKLTVIIYFILTMLTFPLESIVIPQIYSNFFEIVNAKTSIETFVKYFLIILIFLIIINGSIILTEYIEAYMIPEFNEFIVNYIFKNLLYKYENSIKEIELGKLITRLSVIPGSLKEFIADICTWILPRLFTILIINIYFFYLDWKLGLVSFILLGIYIVLCYKNFNKCSYLSNERHTLFEKKNEETQDKLVNSFSIYSNGKLNQEIENYESKTNKYTNKFKDSMMCLNKANVYTTSMIIIIFVTLNSLITYSFMKKKITYNNLITAFIVIIYYMPCIWLINSTMPGLIHYYGTLESVDHFIKELYETDLIKQNEKIKLKTIINSGNIIINNLNFGYNNHSLFKNFYLTIKDKEKVALIGASGNGKSSLIKLIMGYYQVPNGTIFIDKIDINNFDLNDLRAQISYVNQSNKLFNTTLLENIQYGNDKSKEEIIELCEKIDVYNIFKNLKNGLETEVGIEGSNLSGGQRQLVHILRCICKKNKIVILDEPTSAIDKDNTVNIIKAIKELSNNCTVILITHDSSLLTYVDRVITLDEGKIINDQYKNK
jgi:ABC-type multidrug transport system fused ATPase/permease subunit